MSCIPVKYGTNIVAILVIVVVVIYYGRRYEEFSGMLSLLAIIFMCVQKWKWILIETKALLASYCGG